MSKSSSAGQRKACNMQCRRTANAGVLLELDGVRILLDGVCRQSNGYLGTPQREIEALYACPPDLVAFTHSHFDHFDRGFAQKFYDKTLRSILGPEGLLKIGSHCEKTRVGDVWITPVASRHIGKAGQDMPHVSFLIEGTQRILFTGDAAPVQWKDIQVDVLIAPYAYATTASSWQISGRIAPELVLLHLPEESSDSDLLWKAVRETTRLPGPVLHILQLGDVLNL